METNEKRRKGREWLFCGLHKAKNCSVQSAPVKCSLTKAEPSKKKKANPAFHGLAFVGFAFVRPFCTRCLIPFTPSQGGFEAQLIEEFMGHHFVVSISVIYSVDALDCVECV